MGLLDPDRYFSRISDIDIKRDLIAAGITCCLLDIDNTIRSRETGDIPRNAGMWLGRAREAGVRFCLLSNNWHDNVHELARELDLPIVSKACKPFPFAFWVAMKKIEGSKQSTVAIGDQLLTDVLGAHLAGMKAFLLCPLAQTDLRHTLVLRNFEAAIIGDREPERAPVPTALGLLEQMREEAN